MQQPDPTAVPITSSKKIWDVSLTLETKNLPQDAKRDYVLIEAGPEDKQTICEAYQHHGVAGYAIRSIEIVYNLHTEKAFEAHSHKLQKRAGNPAFSPKWEKECTSTQEKEWRSAVVKQCQSLSLQDTSCPDADVNLLPLWHGTNPAIVGSIFETGYANLATTDSGFFGKGLYFSHEAEYAYRVYSHGEGKTQGELGNGGILLFNWVLTHSVYPVIHGDMDKLKEKGNYQNYDAHFIPVRPRSKNPNETVYFPCQRMDKTAVYHEFVVFESAAALPRYLITLESTLLKSLEVTLPNPMQLYQQGIAYKKGMGVSQDFKKAFECFEQAAQLNFPLGLLELGWCYRKGEGIQKDFNAAVKCFSQAAEWGLASAVQELGWCYTYGEGVPKDESQAAIHFEKAAEKGMPVATFRIGRCYFSGTGVEKNRSKAAYYFKQAADKGIKEAQAHYARCCMYGEGVPKNYHKAVKYYQLAADQGDTESKDQLINLFSAQLAKLKQGQNRHILLAQPQAPAVQHNEPENEQEAENLSTSDSNEKCKLQ